METLPLFNIKEIQIVLLLHVTYLIIILISIASTLIFSQNTSVYFSMFINRQNTPKSEQLNQHFRGLR